MGPLPINQVLILMSALGECQQYLKVPISITEGLLIHGFLLLPKTPIPHNADFLGELVKLRDPVEVDCLSGATS